MPHIKTQGDVHIPTFSFVLLGEGVVCPFLENIGVGVRAAIEDDSAIGLKSLDDGAPFYDPFPTPEIILV